MTYVKENNNKNKKPTLIFIHACGVGKWMWYKQKEHFSKFPCLFVELPEHGDNFEMQPFSVNNSVKIIRKTVKNAENEVVLIGHEMGARMILNYLNEYGNEKVSKIVLSSTMIKTVKEGILHKILPSKVIEKEFEKKERNLKKSEFVKKTIDYYGVDEEYSSHYLQDMSRYKPKQLMKLIQEGLLKKISLKPFLNCQIDALIVVGDKETTANIKSAKMLDTYFSNGQLMIVEDATDTHIRTKDYIFNSAVENFIMKNQLRERISK
ncbi:alpha/beta fold hydrolase [Carnobacterium divergens]|uniref:alpha/beta fold hydrolase n=1 Tax=Carnobacterium divergens TaxID=2748 RepID=UPI0007F557EA|nr:alpha/beta hydrolase [Carnobacterium divergens]SBO17138.1 putative alpha/beta hydrolase [Carnobacterium divergens]